MILVPSCRRCFYCSSNDKTEYCDNEDIQGSPIISKDDYLKGSILVNCPLKNVPEVL
jgi:D-arabinose 1-dehydrogenase-like Zn-dependent alcohol dehydrogenase